MLGDEVVVIVYYCIYLDFMGLTPAVDVMGQEIKVGDVNDAFVEINNQAVVTQPTEDSMQMLIVFCHIFGKNDNKEGEEEGISQG